MRVFLRRRRRTEIDHFLHCADWWWVTSHFLSTNKAVEKCTEWATNSIPAGVKNNTAMKLTASHCCFVCQATSYAVTANEAETCWSASTGSASRVCCWFEESLIHTALMLPSLTQSCEVTTWNWWDLWNHILSPSALHITVMYIGWHKKTGFQRILDTSPLNWLRWKVIKFFYSSPLRAQYSSKVLEFHRKIPILSQLYAKTCKKRSNVPNPLLNFASLTQF